MHRIAAIKTLYMLQLKAELVKISTVKNHHHDVDFYFNLDYFWISLVKYKGKLLKSKLNKLIKEIT